MNFKSILFNSNNKLRNGWWIALFLALIVATQPIYRWITTTLRDLQTPELLVEFTSPALILLITFLCARLYKQSSQAVGLGLDRRWLAQFMWGIAFGALWLLAVALPLWLIGGVSFSISPEASIAIVATGFYSFFIGALLEELLHRGFIFQRLIAGTGFLTAQIIMAAVFTFGHLNNPEMDGATTIRASADLALASLILGLAYWRTRSLALPIGLHLGWNWMQGSIMGFNVSGHTTSSLITSTLSDLPAWVTGGGFGLEGSVFSIASSVLVLFILWKIPPYKASNSRALNSTGNHPHAGSTSSA